MKGSKKGFKEFVEKNRSEIFLLGYTMFVVAVVYAVIGSTSDGPDPSFKLEIINSYKYWAFVVLAGVVGIMIMLFAGYFKRKRQPAAASILTPGGEHDN
jgi:hypothetical protein